MESYKRAIVKKSIHDQTKAIDSYADLWRAMESNGKKLFIITFTTRPIKCYGGYGELWKDLQKAMGRKLHI